MLKNITSILIVLLFSCLTAFAQQRLDSVVVSVNRLNVKKYESGKNITVFKQKEINALPVTSVDELLRYVGGINLNTRAGFGVQSDIGMRGSTFSQVLILVDNQRINDPLTAHFNNNIPIPLSEIHHIEIVRGAASAAFGADAVGGIIHIKTKAFVGLWEKEQFSFQGNLGLGQHDLTLSDAGFHQQKKKFGYSGAIKTVSSIGEQHTNPNFTRAGRGDSLYNNFFNLKTFTGAATYRTKRLKLYARAGGDFRDFAAKYFYTASSFDESVEKVNSYWTQAAAIYSGARSTTELTASYRNNTDSFAFNPFFTANEHTTQRINATLSQKRKVEGYNLSYGLQLDHQDIISTDRGDHTTQSYAAFILTNKKFKNLNANGGFRLEYSDKIGAQILPQLNLSYLTENYVVRSSVGRTIRQADFTERFTSYLIPNLSPGRNAGNPDLEAETALNWDIGADVYVSHELQLSNTLFMRQSNNLIDYSLTSSTEINNLTNLQDSSNYLYALNISKSFTWGNEFSLIYNKQLGKKTSIRAQLNYTYINTSTEDSIVSKYIANHPIHNISPILTLKRGLVQLNIGGVYITRNEDRIESINANILANYLIMNAKLSVTSPDMGVGFYVEARNFTNTRYQEILGAQLPGRWLLGGIKWNIHRIKVLPFKQF